MEGKSAIDKLVGQQNWSEWKFQARLTMCAGECFDAATGVSKKPEEPTFSSSANSSAIQTGQNEYQTKLAAYMKKEMNAQKVIGLSLAKEPVMHIMSCDSAKAMWDKLHSIYEQKSKCSIHFLQQKFYNFAKDPNDNLASHFSKLDEIVKQLNDMGEKISDTMLMTKILMTLPMNYSHFHSAWESTSEAERTIENLRTRLMVEENRVTMQEGGESEALIAKRTKNFKSKKLPGKCYNCGEGSHWRRDCPHKGKARESSALVCFYSISMKCDEWYLDSGATWHMTYEIRWLINAEMFNIPKNVKIGNGTFIKAHGRGDMNVSVFNGVSWTLRLLKGVYYVPEICMNLFSAGSTLKNGRKVVLEENKCEVHENGIVVAVGARANGLYRMCFKVQTVDGAANVAVSRDTLRLWHERFAHQNVVHVKEQLKEHKIDYIDEDFTCEACIYGKQKRNSFRSSDTKTLKCGELIHTDVCGPFSNVSIGGSKYFLLFKDDYSKYRTVYFLKSKDEVFDKTVDFVRMAKNCFGINIQTVRSDNAKEYVSHRIEQFLAREGIKHEKTVPYTPEQNGSAERENRTIVESARTMLAAKNLSKQLWAEAINTAVFVLNRTGTSTIKNKTPFELWHNKAIDVNKLKVFGCDVYVHIPNQLRKKLDYKSRKAIFIGYSDVTKGFKVFYPEQRKIEVACNVIFDEKMKTVCIDLNDSESVESIEQNKNVDDQINSDFSGNQNIFNSTANESILETSDAGVQVNAGNLSDDLNESDATIRNSSDVTYDPESEYESAVDNTLDQSEATQIEVQPQGTLCDVNLENVVNARTRSGKNMFCSVTEEDCEFALMAVNNEPKNFQDAVNNEDNQKWQLAMDDEYGSLMQNNTWTLVEKPENASVIDNKWVYKIKYKSNGEIERYKARLVVRGFTQEYGVNYKETFSPVVKFPSIRTILAIAASKNMYLKQFDIKTAFLNSELRETIYMKQPIGYDDGSGKVCKLNKSLYGLKQASRAWNNKFTTFIKQFDFKASKADPCVFIHSTGETYLTIYIDDGLIVSKDSKLIENIIEYLRKHFEVKSFEADSYLNMQIRRGADGSICLHQENYSNRILDRFKMSDCNQLSVPADPNAILYSLDSDETVAFPYREAVGSLMYLAVSTRPDISFAVGLVSRFNENPSTPHVNAVKRILRYIKGTKSYGIFFPTNENLVLYAFSDADFAGCLDTRRSTTGYVFQLGQAIISWASQRQKSVSKSTAESEYKAASDTVGEMVWLHSLLEDLLPNGFDRPILSIDEGNDISDELFPDRHNKPILSVDNQSAIKLVKNPEMHKRTKHIDVSYHFIREHFELGLFAIKHVPSEQQFADILTKPLPRNSFCKLRSMIGVIELN